MKRLSLILIVFALLSCKGTGHKEDKMEMDFESLAFEGVNIDFKFNSDNPTFGDLFLIVGFENPNFPPDSREFEKLTDLGFEQVDDYFGITNREETGDDVRLWLFPIVGGEEVYHHGGPFDAIRITYVVVRNGIETSDLFERTFNSLTSNLDVTPIFEGRTVGSYQDIKQIIDKTIKYCRDDLKVEPGSDEALQLEW